MIVCSQCGSERETPLAKSGLPRTPRRWKVISGKAYCPACKVQQYALRAISIPVAACDWGAVSKLHKEATRDVTRCANWLVTQFYVDDPAHWLMTGEPMSKAAFPEFPKKWKPLYLYNEVRALFPDIEAASLVSLINTVQAKYRAIRFDLWRGVCSLPTFRDLPVPLNSQAFRLSAEDGWKFSFRFSGEWYDLMLRGGSQFARQRRALAQMLTGEIEKGEAALYRKDKALMVKIAAWMPRGSATGANTVTARTAAESFLVAECSSGAKWTLNADHVRRWIIGAAAQQQRLREDLKAERRFPKPMREGIVDRMGVLSERRNNRLDSWMHEASMQLVNWSQRQKAKMLA